MDSAVGANVTLKVGNISQPPEQKDRLFENIKLSDLANKFEAILQRVKELELCHLIEPIQAAAQKLRQLDEVTEKLACDYYDDYSCANKDCCNELNISEDSDPTFFDAPYCSKKLLPSNSDESFGSCSCLNSAGVKSCHCDLSNQNSSKNLTTPNLHKTETYYVEKKSKCNPCKCGIDASGKRNKTLGCKLAAKERKQEQQQRRKTNGDNYSTRPRTADAKLVSNATKKSLDGDLVLERRVSNSRIEVQTNLNEMSLNVNRENTVIRDTMTYLSTRDKSQGVLCKLSSESSSEEYNSGSSSDGVYNGIGVNPFGFFKGKDDSRSESDLGSCGCGRPVETLTCPCGCGDAMDLPPRGKCQQTSRCRCENCGKVIPEPTMIRAEKTVPFGDGHEKVIKGEKVQDNCVIPYTEVKTYIEDLEYQCREKDRIIKELTKRIDRRNSGDESRGRSYLPTYIN